MAYFCCDITKKWKPENTGFHIKDLKQLMLVKKNQINESVNLQRVNGNLDQLSTIILVIILPVWLFYDSPLVC